MLDLIKIVADELQLSRSSVENTVKLLDEDVKKFSHNLRDFRNYIHPHEQLVKEFNPNIQTAKISWNVLKLAMEQMVSNQHKLKS